MEREGQESVIDAIGVPLLLKETAPANSRGFPIACYDKGGRFEQSRSSLMSIRELNLWRTDLNLFNCYFSYNVLRDVNIDCG